MNAERDAKQWITYFSLAAAMLFGCYLRLHEIDLDGLWLDEAFSVAVSNPDKKFSDVYTQTLSDVHPFFYQAVLWIFYKVFGYSEMSGRYLSVFFGVLFIPALFYLACQLFNRRTGLICAWLAAINFYLISYSKETRSYALLVLLVVLSFVFFIALVRKSSITNVVFYGLVVAMLVNTHYFGYLPVMAQVILFFLLFGKKSFQKDLIVKFICAGVFVGLTVAPSLSFIADNLNRRGFWVPAPNDLFFIELFALYFGNASLSVAAAALMIFGLSKLVKDESAKEILWVIAVWVSVCVLVPYVRSLYFQPVLTMRNLIVVLPVVLVLFGYGISVLSDRVLSSVVLGVVVCISMTPLYSSVHPAHTFENQLPPKSHMRELIKTVAGKCSGCLMYSRVDVEFQGYANILGIKLEVKNDRALIKNIESGEKPLNFLIVSTSGMGGMDPGFTEKHDYHVVDETVMGDSSITEYRLEPQ